MASALNHPNIGTIHDVSSAERLFPQTVMEELSTIRELSRFASI